MYYFGLFLLLLGASWQIRSIYDGFKVGTNNEKDCSCKKCKEDLDAGSGHWCILNGGYVHFECWEKSRNL